jgi:hypothetical protein
MQDGYRVPHIVVQRRTGCFDDEPCRIVILARGTLSRDPNHVNPVRWRICSAGAALVTTTIRITGTRVWAPQRCMPQWIMQLPVIGRQCTAGLTMQLLVRRDVRQAFESGDKYRPHLPLKMAAEGFTPERVRAVLDGREFRPSPATAGLPRTPVPSTLQAMRGSVRRGSVASSSGTRGIGNHREIQLSAPDA